MALQKSVDLRAGGNAYDFFFLAMAHGKLGEPQPAREWYRRGVAWLETNRVALEHNQRLRDELGRVRAEAALALGPDGKAD